MSEVNSSPVLPCRTSFRVQRKNAQPSKSAANAWMRGRRPGEDILTERRAERARVSHGRRAKRPQLRPSLLARYNAESAHANHRRRVHVGELSQRHARTGADAIADAVATVAELAHFQG